MQSQQAFCYKCIPQSPGTDEVHIELFEAIGIESVKILTRICQTYEKQNNSPETGSSHFIVQLQRRQMQKAALTINFPWVLESDSWVFTT